MYERRSADTDNFQSNPDVPLGGGLVANHRFSAKPPDPYADYYSLMTAYAGIITQYAKRIDPSVTPLTHRAFDADDEADVFVYRDTASSRAGIGAVNDRLSDGEVAVLGLGGTGSYVLDLLAKTPVKHIALFDGDRFTHYNAFRSPGAASLETVMQVPPIFKVEYFRELYSRMHTGITAHACYIDETNVAQVTAEDFTFLCIDNPSAKRPIVEALVAAGKTFLDVGLGVTIEGTTLGGTLQTILSTDEKRDHRIRIGYGDVDVEDDYRTNIQIADLNALNAALAVISWKKHLGFYRSVRPEYSSLYTIEWNQMDNLDQLDW